MRERSERRPPAWALGMLAAIGAGTLLCTISADCLVDWDQYDRRLATATGAQGGAAGHGGAGGVTGGSGGTGGAGGVAGAGGSGGVTPWSDDTFGRRRRLTFAVQPESLTEFPVLVLLHAGRIDYASMQAGGEDLRFVSSAAEPLAFEVEAWDPAGTSLVWVKVPSIAAGKAGQHIWMYYSNPNATDAQNTPSTWSAGYAGVWHMTPPLTDSTGNGNDGTDSGSVGTDGYIGLARSFDGVASYLQVGSGSTLDNLFAAGGTISAWIQPAGWGGSDLGRIVDKSTTTGSADGWSWSVNSTQTIRFTRRFVDGPRGFDAPGSSILLGQWYYVTLVYNDDTATNIASIYINGVLKTPVVNGAPTGNAADDSASVMRIGNFGAGTTRGFDGIIDEVRAATAARTTGWIAAQYASMTDALVTFGAEETHP